MTHCESPQFHAFDPNGPMRVYVRNLPHWRQPGATYFVTFRQADSIPASVLAEWLDIRQRWWKAHGLSGSMKENAPDQFDQAYASISEGVRRAFEREQAMMLHEEVDLCHGSCVLQYPDAAQHVADALKFFDGIRFALGDYVVMPNHVHAIVTPHDGSKLEDLLGSIKKYSSRQVGKWLADQSQGFQPQGPVQNKPRFWQHESYDRIIRDALELTRFRRYIVDNPLKANLALAQTPYYAAAWLDNFAERPILPTP